MEMGIRRSTFSQKHKDNFYAGIILPEVWAKKDGK